MADERSQIVAEQIVRLALDALLKRIPRPMHDEVFVFVPHALKEAVPQATEKVEALFRED